PRCRRTVQHCVVEQQLTGTATGEVQGITPHLGEVEDAVGRGAGRLVVGALDETVKRDLHLLPAGGRVGEPGLPQLGVFAVGTAVLDLVLDPLATAGTLVPEAESAVPAPVLRCRQVVAEAAPRADVVDDVERVVVGGGTRPVGRHDLAELRVAGRVGAEREDSGTAAGDRQCAFEVLDDGNAGVGIGGGVGGRAQGDEESAYREQRRGPPPPSRAGRRTSFQHATTLPSGGSTRIYSALSSESIKRVLLLGERSICRPDAARR